MTPFFTLFETFSDRARPAPDSAGADDWFCAAVAGSPFHLWRPGDAIPERGTRVLLGVATWSGYDMRLLDVIDKATTGSASAAPRVDVFNVADCKRPGTFQKHIPKLRQVFHSPVAGVWRDGDLNWSGQGHEAREQVARMFGSSSGEIVAYVRGWLEKRPAAS